MPTLSTWPTLGQMLAHDDLGSVDPVVMNLVVAKGIPSLANLDIGHYVGLADSWAADLLARMAELEDEHSGRPRNTGRMTSTSFGWGWSAGTSTWCLVSPIGKINGTSLRFCTPILRTCFSMA